MSPSPDWYPDPTNASRLRYWDGVMWTQWVTTDGDTSEDPIAGTPPPPPAEGHAGWSGVRAEPAAPAEPPQPSAPASEPPTAYRQQQAGQPTSSGPLPAEAAPANTPRSLTPPSVAPPAPAEQLYSSSIDQVLLRGGLGVAALGGIITTFSAGQVGAQQEILGRPSELDVGGGAFTALVAAIVIIGAAAAPWLWAQITGIGIAAALAIGSAFAVISFRTNEDFVEILDVSLGTGGWIILAGSLVAFAGLALALLGIAMRPPKQQEPDKSKGVAALVLGIAGFPLGFAAALGVTFGLLGMAESRNAKEGRGLSLAGFIVGLVALVLWFLIVTAAMFFAEPTSGS